MRRIIATKGKFPMQFLVALVPSLIFCITTFLEGSPAQSRNHSPRVGILSALPQEMEEIEKVLQHTKHSSIKGDNFITGALGNSSVVLTLSGVGKVNATIAAQRLISNFNVSSIVFTGVAGGIDKEIEIGDIVIAESLFQHDAGFLGETFIRHRPGHIPEVGIGNNDNIKFDTAAWPRISGKRFFEMIHTFCKGIENSLSPVAINGKTYHPKVVRGSIATGDQFIANAAKRKELEALGADVVEMEGAAVAQVCDKNNIPCLVIRAVSDKAGVEAKIDFQEFLGVVAKNNARLVHAFLAAPKFKNYMDSLEKPILAR